MGIQGRIPRIRKRIPTRLACVLATILLIAASAQGVSGEVEDFQQLRVFGFNAFWVQYSPDGRRIAAGVPWGVVRLLDAETFEQEDVQLFSEATIIAVRWSPSGQYLATGHSRGNDPAEITIWDVKASPPVLARTLHGHQLRVTSLSWSPESDYLASASYDGQIKIWNVETGELILSFPHATTAVAWSPDGKYIAGGSYASNTVRIYEAKTGDLIRELSGHSGGVESVAWSPDSRYLASGGSLFMVIVWNAQTGELLRRYEGGGQWVEWSPNGKYLAGAGGTIRIWEPIESGALIRRLGEGEGLSHQSLSWSPDSRLMISAGGFEMVEWEVQTGKRLRTLHDSHSYGQPVTLSVAWSPDGKDLASSGGRSIKIWDIARFNSIRTIIDEVCLGVAGIEWSPDGRYIASSGCNLVVWEAATGEEVKRFEVGGYLVTWSPDGTSLAYYSYSDAAILIWEFETEKLTKIIEIDTPLTVNAIAWSPDGKYLACSGCAFNFAVHVWETGTWELIRTLEGLHGQITSITWSPESRYLAGISYTYDISIWELETEQLVRLIEQPGPMVSLAWSPSGKYLASGSTSGPSPTIKIWDAGTGELIKTLLGHQGVISSVKWSPDERYLASCASYWEGMIRLWGARPEEAP